MQEKRGKLSTSQKVMEKRENSHMNLKSQVKFPRAGAVCAPQEGTGQAGQRYCVHTTVLFVCSIPPPHSATELVSLKNQQTEVKQREPPWK